MIRRIEELMKHDHGGTPTNEFLPNELRKTDKRNLSVAEKPLNLRIAPRNSIAHDHAVS